MTHDLHFYRERFTKKKKMIENLISIEIKIIDDRDRERDILKAR